MNKRHQEKQRIGAKVREQRDLLRLTQKELADLAGVSRISISNIERGIGLSLDGLLALSEALGVKPSFLLEEDTPSALTFLEAMEASIEDQSLWFRPVGYYGQAFLVDGNTILRVPHPKGGVPALPADLAIMRETWELVDPDVVCQEYGS